MKYLNAKGNSGFVIMSALTIGTLLFISAIGVMAYKKTLDKDFIQSASRHTMSVAQDTLKTSIQLNMADRNSLDDIKNDIRSLDQFSAPVVGTKCGNDLCKIKVKRDAANLPLISFGYKSVDGSGNVVFHPDTEDPVSGNQFAYITLAYEGNNGDSHNSVSLADLEVEVLLPKESILIATGGSAAADSQLGSRCIRMANPWTSAECAGYMRSSFCPENPTNDKCKNLNPLICPHNQPIFTGTTTDSQGIERAICRAIPTSDVLVTAGSTSTSTKCNIAQGRWLSSVGNDFTFQCSSFPDGLQSQSEVTFCTSPNQVAKNYSFDGTLNPINIKCINMGGPYDFISESRLWGE
ncbi:MAG: hypothetical protein R3A80_12710 [Bdellovibrionota bacterium]